MAGRLVLAALVLAAACSAGCGSSQSSAGSPSTSSHPMVTRPPTTPPDTFSGGGRTTVVGSGTPDETVLLERIDVGRHDGFDRVVFRFRGANLPGYRVGFVPRPLREDGSGNEIPIDGEKIIGVRMDPASGFDLEDEGSLVYKGPKRIEGSQYGTQVVTELARTGDFESVLNWAIGLRHASDFRVLRLDRPPRLVVDVADS